MARLEAVANVALRVPGLALLDLLYRWDAAALGDLLRPRRGDPPLLRPPALRGAYCLGEGCGGTGGRGGTATLGTRRGGSPRMDRLGTRGAPRGWTGWGHGWDIVGTPQGVDSLGTRGDTPGMDMLGETGTPQG